MEIIKVDIEGDYERYENLILQKEQYEKEAFLYEMAYQREFGKLLIESFQIKIDCIALKKKIALFVQAKNQGRNITEKDIRDFMKRYMQAYREELEAMQEAEKEAGRMKTIPEFTIAQCKTIYRRLARKLHPDTHPEICDNDELMELFMNIVVAYNYNDLKRLQELEVIANRYLDELGMTGEPEILVPNIQERIEELLNEINNILENIPYTYKELLENEDAVKQKKKEIRDEIESYEQYKTSLADKFREVQEMMRK